MGRSLAPVWEGVPLYLSGFPQTFSLRLRRDVRRGNEMREDTEGAPKAGSWKVPNTGFWGS